MKLRIKEVIKDRGMTVAEVAIKMGIGSSALTQSMYGNPSFEKLCEISKAIGCSISELIEEEKSADTITCPHCGKKFKMIPVDE